MLPQFQRVVTLLALVNLVALFAWIYAREHQQRVRLWMTGWVAVVIHAAGNVLRVFHWISEPLARGLAYSTLSLTACAFLLSVRPVRGKGRIAAILIPAAGGIGLIAASRNPPLFGMDFLLSTGFALTALCYWRYHDRCSPGICLTSFALLAWSLVFPAMELCRFLHADVGGDEALWDLPKYFVAFGMMVTLLENQAGMLQTEARERRRAEEAAKTASEAKSICLATVSHEIRTPMNGVIGMTDLLLDSKLTQEQREDLNMVKASAESLLSVINDVLDFAKIEAGRMTLEQIGFDLPEAVGELMRTMSFRAHQKGLELICDLRGDVPGTVVGDPVRLRQVLVNLVGNAVKFTESGEVELTVEKQSASPDGTVLHFIVRDTGIGIPEDKRHLIFQPFTQADCSTTRRYGGTGLGLAVSSRLASLMHGSLSFEDARRGAGSVFHFTARFGVPDQPLAKPAMIHMDGLRDRHVLVVDDNATNRQVLLKMATRWGMQAVAVSGGAEALELVRQRLGRPDLFGLILVDCEMPDMDGFETAERLRRMPGMSAPLVMLRSVGYAADSSTGPGSVFAATLTKPVRQGELLQTIRTVMEASPAPTPPLPRTPPDIQTVPAPLRILVAEDNPVNRAVALRMLEKCGHSVSTAENGLAAVAAAETERFDLILMDIQMPGMDGLEATAAIRGREIDTGAHIPIVAMTAHAMKGDEERCRAAGMDSYLSKPIQRVRLMEVLKQVSSGRVFV